jgi:hypothetical protein
MNIKELLEHHKEITTRCLAIMRTKNHDYAGNSGETPFANFQRCESMEICSTESGFLVRVVDKVSRLVTFVESGELMVEGESYEDAVMDIINYMVLFSAYVKSKEKLDNPLDKK